MAVLAPPTQRKTRPRLVVASLLLAMFLSAMEATIVATAMPSIVSKLGGFAEYTWVFALFLLTQTASIPIYGKLADLYGRRRVFAVGTGVFLVGSLLCGMSGSMAQLIGSRAIQGLGAGAVQPIASTIVGDLFTIRERARVQGWLSSVWAFASVFGPVVGGYIVEHLDWQWIFLLNIPLGLAAIAGVLSFLQEPPQHSEHEIDYAGAVLLTIGVVLLLFLLLQGGTAWPWASVQTLGLLLGSAVGLGAFVARERRAREPIVPLGLLRLPVVAIADAGTVLLGGMTLSLSTFIPLYVQGALGTTATVAGLTLAVLSIAWPIASVLASHLIIAVGFRNSTTFGFLLAAVGSGLLATRLGTGSPVHVGASLIALGLGLGFVSTTVIVAIQSAVAWEQRGTATASNMFARQLGSMLWVAVLGSILNSFLLAHLATLPAGAQATLGQSGLGVTTLLLDPQARSSLPGTLLADLETTLADGVRLVFTCLLATALAGVVIALRLPHLEVHPTGGGREAGSEG